MPTIASLLTRLHHALQNEFPSSFVSLAPSTSSFIASIESHYSQTSSEVVDQLLLLIQKYHTLVQEDTQPDSELSIKRIGALLKDTTAITKTLSGFQQSINSCSSLLLHQSFPKCNYIYSLLESIALKCGFQVFSDDVEHGKHLLAVGKLCVVEVLVPEYDTYYQTTRMTSNEDMDKMDTSQKEDKQIKSTIQWTINGTTQTIDFSPFMNSSELSTQTITRLMEYAHHLDVISANAETDIFHTLVALESDLMVLLGGDSGYQVISNKYQLGPTILFPSLSNTNNTKVKAHVTLVKSSSPSPVLPRSLSSHLTPGTTTHQNTTTWPTLPVQLCVTFEPSLYVPLKFAKRVVPVQMDANQGLYHTRVESTRMVRNGLEHHFAKFDMQCVEIRSVLVDNLCQISGILKMLRPYATLAAVLPSRIQAQTSSTSTDTTLKSHITLAVRFSPLPVIRVLSTHPTTRKFMQPFDVSIDEDGVVSVDGMQLPKEYGDIVDIIEGTFKTTGE